MSENTKGKIEGLKYALEIYLAVHEGEEIKALKAAIKRLESGEPMEGEK